MHIGWVTSFKYIATVSNIIYKSNHDHYNNYISFKQQESTEFDNGPSSFSTLHILPDFMQELMNESEIEAYYEEEKKQQKGNKNKNKTSINTTNHRNNKINNKNMNEANDSDQDVYIHQPYPSMNQSQSSAISTDRMKV